MPFEQDVKELAYVIDPPCWVSYSGKGRNFKAAMDDRRTKALKQAQDKIDEIKDRRMGHRVSDEPDVVKVRVHGGIVQAVAVPDGVKVLVYDYDGEGPNDFEDTDETGEPCNIAEFTP